MSVDKTGATANASGAADSAEKATRVLAIIQEATIYTAVATGGDPSVAAPKPPAAKTPKPAGEQENDEEADTDTREDEGFIIMTTQINEHFDSCRNWARTWMILFVGSLILELLLTLAFVLTFLITYKGEILTSDRLLDRITTQSNVRVVIVALFIAMLLVNVASQFHERWRLNQSTMSKLASLKIDLTDPKRMPAEIRNDFRRILEQHHLSVEAQKPFLGTKL